MHCLATTNMASQTDRQTDGRTDVRQHYANSRHAACAEQSEKGRTILEIGIRDQNALSVSRLSWSRILENTLRVGVWFE